jgi:putative flippase GtrA
VTLIRRMLSNEVFRFLLSGGSLFVLDITAFIICRKVFGIEVFWAELMARTVGASTGFLVHKFFTFAREAESSAMSTRSQGFGYAVTTLFNLALSPFLVAGLVYLLAPYEVFAKALGSILLAMETFLVFRFIFRDSGGADRQ